MNLHKNTPMEHYVLKVYCDSLTQHFESHLHKHTLRNKSLKNHYSYCEVVREELSWPRVGNLTHGNFQCRTPEEWNGAKGCD